jgi:hypothetical protein
LLAHGRWFSPGTLASSTTKTGHHDIAEILLKVALKHQISKSKIKSNGRKYTEASYVQKYSNTNQFLLLCSVTMNLFLE